MANALYIDHSNANKEITLDTAADRTKFLVAEGYVSKKSGVTPDPERGEYATSVPAADDPRLAANREAPVPVNAIPAHVANEDVTDNVAEKVLGKNMGYDAPLVTDNGPAVADATPPAP